MHGSFDGPSGADDNQIVIPDINESEVRIASLDDVDSGESIFDVQELKYAIRNHVSAKLLKAARLKRQLREFNDERDAVTQRLRWAAPTVPRTNARTPIGLLNTAFATLFGIGSLVCSVSSIWVLMDYLQASSTGLFSQSPIAALSFAMLPSIGAALTVKNFELRLESERARWIFICSLTGVGLVGLACWLGGGAFGLAPDTASAASALLEGGSSRAPGMILVVTTVICDIAFGAAMLSGVSYCLSPKHTPDQVPNPVHVALTKEKLRIAERIAECEREFEDVEGYLTRAEAGRRLTRHLANQALNRAREQFTVGQEAARAFFTALYLSNKN